MAINIFELTEMTQPTAVAAAARSPTDALYRAVVAFFDRQASHS
jgi:hypothetical protein